MIIILFSFRLSKMHLYTGKFEVLPIPATLKRVIKNSWRITIGQPPIQIIPDGMLHLYLFLPTTTSLALLPVDKTYTTSFLRGLSQEVYSVQGKPGTSFILYTVYPWIGNNFFNADMSELVNKQLVFPNLFTNSTKQKKGVNSTLFKVFSSLEQQEVEQIELVKKAYFQIMKDEGKRTITQIAMQACLSKSSLRKKFYQFIGLSPKNLAKVSRNFSVVNALHHNFKGNLTDLAYQFGYYDQAHFIRAFRQVMRSTPSQYLVDTTNTFIPYQVQQNAFSPTFST